MSNQIFIADLPDAQMDEACGMQYWNAKLEAGRGMTKRSQVVPQLLDEEVHQDFHTITQMEDLSGNTVQAAINDMIGVLSPDDKEDVQKMELLYRRLGWLAAFAFYMEPDIRKQYESIPYDGDMLLNRDPLFVIAHPDRILRDRITKDITYREYVPMVPGLQHKAWLQGWLYNIRLHVGIAAAEENLHEDVHFGQVMGLNKGYISLVDNRMRHPYVYGYRNKNNRNEWATSIGKPADSWELFPIWEFPGGVVQWVQLNGRAVAESQFPMSPLTLLRRDSLESWVAVRLHREREVKRHQETCMTSPNLRRVYFPMNTTRCVPVVGDKCQFLAACWDEKVKDGPVLSGKYVLNAEPQAIPISEVVM